MKRIICVFLSLIMLSLSSVQFNACAEDGTVASEIQRNPFYEEREVYSENASQISYISINSDNGTVYYPLGDELYKTVKAQLMARSSGFSVYYVSSTQLKTKSAVSSVMDKLLAGATEEELSTGSADGDYLRWSVQSFGAKTTTLDKTENKKYYYTFNLAVTYYSTAEQEKKAAAEINRFIKSLKADTLSDYQKVKSVHDYICERASYDYNAESTPSRYPSAFTPYGALIEGKAVCQGYASSFYRICKELGLEVRFVSSSANSGQHAWNIVALDGKFYFVDCTWDDLNIDEKKGDGHQFFLKSYECIAENDSSKNEHLLDEKYYATETFNENYASRFDENNYDITNPYLFSRCKILIKYKDKALLPEVLLKNEKNQKLKEGREYKLKYKRIKNGRITAELSGMGKYKGSSTEKTVKLLPSKTYKKSSGLQEK